MIRRTFGRRRAGCAAAAPAPPAAQPAPAAPIALHPDNPHYFLWRGRPTILITSAEHYGAVMNLDFDYRKYLDTLAADGMNYTRVFSGAYVEPAGRVQDRAQHAGAAARAGSSRPGRAAASPGHPDGGNKFDLSRWDDAYFARLKDFVAHAAARNIVVELTLFCPMYEEVQWSLSPMNAANNVNGVGDGRPQRGLHARQGSGAAGRAGSADPQARHRAERASRTCSSRSPTSRTSAA